MPTYEYQCKACGHELEVFQKISDEPLHECPKCHEPSLTKLISATNFQLKGTGWYVTDFKDKGKAKEKSDESGSSEKKTETKADSGNKKDEKTIGKTTETNSAKTGES